MIARLKCSTRLFSVSSLRLSDAASSQAQVSEDQIKKLLKKKFPSAREVEVQDISGGCGAMFEVYVSTAEFKGLSTVKQHQLINKTLQEEIKNMHGIRIHTAVPE
ncbi:unnamed protein product [Bemisia tabaci]|uniref:BolA-like protein 3 n=1 Tax=Bemisia tabaci TaxID=7038 RepID=A0A9P0F139_BEMTA|nr:unnamed protein product [Bemisia tabaci]